MDRLLWNLEQFVPEALELIRLRYQVTKEILHNGPIGRRQISTRVGCSERAARSEIEALKEAGIVEITTAGIVLTDYGIEMIHSVEDVISHLEGLAPLAHKLKRLFGLDHVIVVPGDSFVDVYAKKDLGRAAARHVKELLSPGCVLAVTGGTTLAEVAQAMTPGPFGEGVLVLPARGGLGEEMEAQANAIASHIAKAIGGHYRLLHIPDSLDEETITKLMNNPQVAEILNQLKTSDVLVHGIGSAIEMACRRGLAEDALKILEDKQAVGEAFRYYFNQEGEIVYCMAGIGLELADIEGISRVIAVAGGSNKARAIEAVLANRRRGTLITDEGAARAIIERRDQLCCV